MTALAYFLPVLVVIVAVILIFKIFTSSFSSDNTQSITKYDIYGKKSIKKINKDDFPYKKKEYLCTKPELTLYEKMIGLIDERYTLIPQVTLSDIIMVDRSKIAYNERRIFRSKIDKKSIDFVVFSSSSLSPILCIEYDDKSHDTPKRKERDAFVDDALAIAGIPIIHIKYHSSQETILLKNLNTIIASKGKSDRKEQSQYMKEGI